MELTETQQRLYAWIVEYFRVNGFSPQYREIMEGVGMKSIAPVQYQLGRLKKLGYIDWSHREARSIRLLKYRIHIQLIPIEDAPTVPQLQSDREPPVSKPRGGSTDSVCSLQLVPQLVRTSAR
jgi:SOS-response transcriptional repressor LexA